MQVQTPIGPVEGVVIIDSTTGTPENEAGTSSQTTTITSSTAETTIVTAGAAGVKNNLTSLSISNSSATATLVTLKDATGGTTRGIWSIAAGGSLVLTYPRPKAQATAAANWTLTCGTSVASIYVVAEYLAQS